VLNPVKRNYEIHDTEMLAIIQGLEEWQHYLEGTTPHGDLDRQQEPGVFQSCSEARLITGEMVADNLYNRPTLEYTKANSLQRPKDKSLS
jgi:hypothetical protein